MRRLLLVLLLLTSCAKAPQTKDAIKQAIVDYLAKRDDMMASSMDVEVVSVDFKEKEAEAVGVKLDGQTFVVIRSASDAGALYGSVTTRDAAEAATDAGFTVNRGQIVLDRPIKDLGLHTVTVVLHPEVTVKVNLNVARSVEEAALQASGKSIQDLAAEAEAAADFEIAELFDDLGGAASDDA